MKSELRECSYQEIWRRPCASIANPRAVLQMKSLQSLKQKCPEIHIRALIRACANPISFPFIKSYNFSQHSLQNFTYACIITLKTSLIIF